MQFNVTITGLDQLVAKLKEAPSIAAPILQRALSASQAILAKYTTKGIVPWRTGFLVQSFRAEMTPAMLRWFPTADYAPHVEFGTKPHTITAKNAKALYWPGAAHPVKSVKHPGTIIAASQPEIDEKFGQALTQIVAAIAAQ
jgi:hypothetical protein